MGESAIGRCSQVRKVGKVGKVGKVLGADGGAVRSIRRRRTVTGAEWQRTGAERG